MKFEKWQALGNDYLILEREQLPFELTAPEFACFAGRISAWAATACCCCALRRPTLRGQSLRIYNPDGSEAELSGNGAREAMLYLRRHGWTDKEVFSIQTAAGAITPTITGPNTCRVDMGVASLVSSNFPSGPRDGRAEANAGGRRWTFQFVSIGNPQCAIHVEDRTTLEALDVSAIGPAIERISSFPTAPTSRGTRRPNPNRIRARIFERGVGETLSSGTGATGAAVAYHLRGGGLAARPSPSSSTAVNWRWRWGRICASI